MDISGTVGIVHLRFNGLKNSKFIFKFVVLSILSKPEFILLEFPRSTSQVLMSMTPACVQGRTASS